MISRKIALRVLLTSSIGAPMITSITAEPSKVQMIGDALVTFSGEVLSLSWQATSFFMKQAYNGTCWMYSQSKPYVLSAGRSLHARSHALYKKYVDNQESDDNVVHSLDPQVEEVPECPICFEERELFSFCTNDSNHQCCRPCMRQFKQSDNIICCPLCREELDAAMLNDLDTNPDDILCFYCRTSGTDLEELKPIFSHDSNIYAHETCHESNIRRQELALS